jgi:RNA 3'-terminal phosphate cyclase (ATP)
MAMIHIDGSQGEGGGQILRSSLALSMALGEPFEITGIRANRPKPGLMRQHLTAVEAAAAICSARVEGASPGSPRLVFEPGAVRGGSFRFSVGTAGSTTLVLQAVLPALLFTGERSELVIEGGTHARWAPTFDYFERAMLPLLSRLGGGVTGRLESHGFYPAGGGRIRVEIGAGTAARALRLEDRGEVRTCRAAVVLAKLPPVIARRELERVRERLGWEVDPQGVRQCERALSPGNVVLLEVESEHVTEVFSAIGEQGKPSERVADEVIDEVRAYLASDAPAGPYTADQLMVPMAVACARGAGACSLRTPAFTGHASTNAEVIEAFLPGLSRTARDERGVRWSVGE